MKGFIANTITSVRFLKLVTWVILLILGSRSIAQSEIIQPSGCSGDPMVTVSVFHLSGNTCAGDSNASFYITVSGISTYSVSWSNGAVGDTLYNLGAGGYQFLISSPSLTCSVFDTVEVNDPEPLLVVLVSQENVTCTGENDGEIIVDFTGNTDTVSYAWSNGSINYIVPSLFAGTYTVSITDSSGCVAIDSYEITEPASLPYVDSAVIVDAYCLGGEVGSITVTPAGGTSPYSYSWNSGNVNNSPQNLGAGTYLLTITDGDGCTSDTSFTVNEPATAAAPVLNTVDLSCHGSEDGSISATPLNGTSPFFYYWSNNATTAQITDLAAGAYNVLIYDAEGCTWYAEDTVHEPTEIVASVIVDQNILCQGDSSATAAVSAIGGSSPYSFSWSQGSNSANVIGLGAGIYTCVVLDSIGCSDSVEITVSEPDAIGLVFTNTIEPACHGDQNGTIEVVAEGGMGNLLYSWNTGDTTTSIHDLSAGTYGLTVTDSNGCVLDTHLALTQPDILITNIVEEQPAFCSNDSDGILSAAIAGGTPGYSFVWSTGDTSNSISQLTVGSYMVTVTDANGCTDTADSQLTFLHAAPQSGLASTVVFCDTLQGDLVAAEGFANYSWSTGEITNIASITDPGTYYVTITSGFGCVNVDSTIVTFGSSFPFDLGNDTLLCTNKGDSGLFLTAPANYASYLWNTSDTNAVIWVSTPGIYALTAVNIQGCPYTDSLEVRIEDCPPVAVNTPNSVLDPIIYPNPTSGHLTVEWLLNGYRYAVFTIDGTLILDGFAPGYITTINFSHLPKGIYFIKVFGQGVERIERVVRG